MQQTPTRSTTAMTKTNPKTAYITIDEVHTIHQHVLDIWTIAGMLKKRVEEANDDSEAIVLSDALDNRIKRLSDMLEPIADDAAREAA
jgi:hypothetical protein